MSVRILTGDCRALLDTLDAGSVQCCVTSPPYWGLRDYGVEGQLGLERTPDEYVANMVDVFARVRRVLRDDGTVWLNLGDSYARNGGDGGCGPNAQVGNTRSGHSRRMTRVPDSRPPAFGSAGSSQACPCRSADGCQTTENNQGGLKPKDLVGIPWRVALALQADGWYLRSDIIWHKPNPMPESVTDRPTKAHEYLFLLTKAERYYYDAEAVMEDVAESQIGRIREDVIGGTSHVERGQHSKGGTYSTKPRESVPRGGFNGKTNALPGREAFRAVTEKRNRRTVWTVATQPFSGAHFATFPPKLIEPCILAGSKRGDTVLDPFGGAGTTGLVADRLGRDAILLELNPTYAAMAEARIRDDAPLFADGAA